MTQVLVRRACGYQSTWHEADARTDERQLLRTWASPPSNAYVKESGTPSKNVTTPVSSEYSGQYGVSVT